MLRHAAFRTASRGFRAGRPAQSGFVEADSSGKLLHLHHKVNLALLGLAPIAVIASPSPINLPIDLALGVALPYHAHIGMNLVATDYVKKLFGKGAVTPVRLALAAFTGATALGLLKLNLTGPGITETVKGFWRPKAD